MFVYVCSLLPFFCLFLSACNSGSAVEPPAKPVSVYLSCQAGSCDAPDICHTLVAAGTCAPACVDNNKNANDSLCQNLVPGYVCHTDTEQGSCAPVCTTTSIEPDSDSVCLALGRGLFCDKGRCVKAKNNTSNQSFLRVLNLSLEQPQLDVYLDSPTEHAHFLISNPMQLLPDPQGHMLASDTYKLRIKTSLDIEYRDDVYLMPDKHYLLVVNNFSLLLGKLQTYWVVENEFIDRSTTQQSLSFTHLSELMSTPVDVQSPQLAPTLIWGGTSYLEKRPKKLLTGPDSLHLQIKKSDDQALLMQKNVSLLPHHHLSLVAFDGWQTIPQIWAMDEFGVQAKMSMSGVRIINATFDAVGLSLWVDGQKDIKIIDENSVAPLLGYSPWSAQTHQIKIQREGIENTQFFNQSLNLEESHPYDFVVLGNVSELNQKPMQVFVIDQSTPLRLTSTTFVKSLHAVTGLMKSMIKFTLKEQGQTASTLEQEVGRYALISDSQEINIDANKKYTLTAEIADANLRMSVENISLYPYLNYTFILSGDGGHYKLVVLSDRGQVAIQKNE